MVVVKMEATGVPQRLLAEPRHHSGQHGLLRLYQVYGKLGLLWVCPAAFGAAGSTNTTRGAAAAAAAARARRLEG